MKKRILGIALIISVSIGGFSLSTVSSDADSPLRFDPNVCPSGSIELVGCMTLNPNGPCPSIVICHKQPQL